MTKSISPLISAEEVIIKTSQPGTVIVDARGGADAKVRFQAGHVRGAILLDLETELSDKTPDPAVGGRHPLPAPGTFAALLGKKGINPDSQIFVYDDKAGANAAARFWWMMKAAGHSKIQVVDGGLAALQQAGVPLEEATYTEPSPQSHYPITNWRLPLASINTVDRARTDSGSLVIDVREGYRYRGESEPIDLVAGHIPGAINIPYLSNLEANGKFRPADTLANFYRHQLGNKKPENIIVHCGSGVTACHTLLAMEIAALPLPQLYVGSWSEWSRNNKPIATGEKR